MTKYERLKAWTIQLTLKAKIDPEPASDEERKELERLRESIDAIIASGGGIEIPE